MTVERFQTTAKELADNYQDQSFVIKGGRVVWETISHRPSGKFYISRISKDGTGKPFLMGLFYKYRYIDADTILELVGCCPYCGDPECKSDHK